MKYFLPFLLCLVSCATFRPQSFVVIDYESNQCYFLPSSPISVDGEVRWRTIDDKSFHTSERFDLKVVRNEDYNSAAKALGWVDVTQCRSGLMP